MTVSARIPLRDDQADLVLAAKLREQYYEHAAVRVLTNEPLKKIEEDIGS